MIPSVSTLLLALPPAADCWDHRTPAAGREELLASPDAASLPPGALPFRRGRRPGQRLWHLPAAQHEAQRAAPEGAGGPLRHEAHHCEQGEQRQLAGLPWARCCGAPGAPVLACPCSLVIICLLVSRVQKEDLSSAPGAMQAVEVPPLCPCSPAFPTLAHRPCLPQCGPPSPCRAA